MLRALFGPSRAGQLERVATLSRAADVRRKRAVEAAKAMRSMGRADDGAAIELLVEVNDSLRDVLAEVSS